MAPEVTNPADGMTDYGLIELAGTENTRDQGGMETVTGQRVRAKKLIRSDKLQKLDDHDIHVLVDEYEVRTVIDLRTEKEREIAPNPTSRMPEVRFVDLPVFTESAVGITREHSVHSLLKEFNHMKEDPHKVVRDIYPVALVGDAAIKAFTQFFEILLAQEEGAVLWHCSEGKDRTGIASMLILHALGVPPETIMEDYLATNIFAKRKVRKAATDLERLHLLTKGDEALLAIMTASPDYLEAANEAAEEKYGSLDSYLEEALGLTPEKRALLAEKYLF